MTDLSKFHHNIGLEVIYIYFCLTSIFIVLMNCVLSLGVLDERMTKCIWIYSGANKKRHKSQKVHVQRIRNKERKKGRAKVKPVSQGYCGGVQNMTRKFVPITRAKLKNHKGHNSKTWKIQVGNQCVSKGRNNLCCWNWWLFL